MSFSAPSHGASYFLFRQKVAKDHAPMAVVERTSCSFDCPAMLVERRPTRTSLCSNMRRLPRRSAALLGTANGALSLRCRPSMAYFLVDDSGARWQPPFTTLHELTTFEGSDVGLIQIKPFAIFTLISIARVPVRLDTSRVIGSDDMQCFRRFWELERNLPFSSPRSV